MAVKKKKKHYLNGKTILITGGTGSFGKAFIKKVLDPSYKVKRLVVYSRDELKQEEMRTMHGFQDKRLRYFIGDVRDKDRLIRALVDIDVVIHAAALKQVLACEYNPIEAIRTNINGAEHIISAAIDRRVKKVLALSTDKAVNPVNLYGATKLVAEKLFIQGNNYSSTDGTRFSCVRYGNVVGSRGSVVPLFLHQRTAGVITVTDMRMTRFWITLEQATQFVVDCIDMMRGGEMFIPQIPSMKITDLAKAIAPNCRIKEIGIRAGEKLHETLISSEESRNTYKFHDKYIIRPMGLFREPKNNLWKRSKLMVPSTSYVSNVNGSWLTIEKLKEITG